MVQPKGKIIIEPGLNIWAHELCTAKALASAGYTVEFIRRSEAQHIKTPDVIINGMQWEIKSPTAGNLKTVERNLKRGRWQSGNIVFDCRRMKKVPNGAIEREVRKQAYELKGISRLLYINKRGFIVDIK